jgi:dolichol-phosphate mannosyltransferase
MQHVDISVVAPCHNEAENLAEFVNRVTAVLDGKRLSYEIIVIDDGSRDATLQTAKELALRHPSLTVISFSRNFGHQAAVTAGIDHAAGKAVVLIDADLQDPPEVIAAMIEKWQEGYHVVYGQRRSREGETPFKLITARLFYRLLRLLTDRHIPVDTGDFRLMDRSVVDALKSMREKHRFIRGMVSWVGFRQTPVLYDRKPRFAGSSNYPTRKMVLFALDAITSFSAVPLRFITVFGIIIIFATILISLAIIVIKVYLPSYFIPGFPVLTLLILFFGGAQLFAVGIVGEYLGRVYEETKHRPLYIVQDIVTGRPGPGGSIGKY